MQGVDWEAAYSFWEWSDDRLGHMHMYAAIAALILGPAIFVRRKGDLVHRLLGLAYVFAMLFTNATALAIYDFTGGLNVFHLAAVLSLITTVAGLICVLVYAASRRKGALAAHIEWMAWSYFGLVLAAGAEAWTRGLGPQIDDLGMFWIAFGVFMLLAGAAGQFMTRTLITRMKRTWIENAV